MTASVDPVALRTARQQAGLTQHQLARALEVAGGEAVARWERGASEPKPTTLRRLADALQVVPSDLLRLDGGNIDLRYLRLAAGLESKTVAEQLHVSVATYLRWERGAWAVTPGQTAVAGLAAVFGVKTNIVVEALVHTLLLARQRRA